MIQGGGIPLPHNERMKGTPMMHNADVAKFEQLIRDCQAKINEYESLTWRAVDQQANLTYWRGFMAGLQRGLTVVKGQG